MERYRLKRTGFVFDVPTTDIIINGIHHIQRNIGMESPLTFHMARHTFASLITLSAGVPIETVSLYLYSVHADRPQFHRNKGMPHGQNVNCLLQADYRQMATLYDFPSMETT